MPPDQPILHRTPRILENASATEPLTLDRRVQMRFLRANQAAAYLGLSARQEREE